MTMLEMILREEDGILKSHLIKKCGLKSKTADKYLDKMLHAEYIIYKLREWGDRQTIWYLITNKGFERYEWFVKINAELEQ